MGKIDLDTTQSQRKGIVGFFESALRRFKVVMHLVLMLPIYLVACCVLALAFVPSIYTFQYLQKLAEQQNQLIQNMTLAFSLATGYFIYGFTLVFVVPAANFIFQAKLKSWRGPYYSVESLKWFIHNGLTYLVRYTFLEFITPSPLALSFYKMMGMKVGAGTVINTTWISDPSLIEMGRKVTIGGSVTIVAHYGQQGLLVVAPVYIGNSVTVGLKSSIMGGVRIGDNARIMPHSVVLPKTTIPAGEIWGGVPAIKIESTRMAQEDSDKKSNSQNAA